MHLNEAHRRAETLFKKEQQPREAQQAYGPTTKANCMPCEGRLPGCGHSGWLARPPIRAARQIRTRHGEREHHIHVLAMATSHRRNYTAGKGTLEDCRPQPPSSK